MAPGLLTMAEAQRLKGLFRRLVAGETGPFVMTSGRAQLSQPPIGFRLMKPICRTGSHPSGHHRAQGFTQAAHHRHHGQLIAEAVDGRTHAHTSCTSRLSQGQGDR